MSASKQREIALRNEIKTLELAWAQERGRSAALEERCKALEARSTIDVPQLLAKGKEVVQLWKQIIAKP